MNTCLPGVMLLDLDDHIWVTGNSLVNEVKQDPKLRNSSRGCSKVQLWDQCYSQCITSLFEIYFYLLELCYTYMHLYDVQIYLDCVIRLLTKVSLIEKCLNMINGWMCQTKLLLNKEKKQYLFGEIFPPTCKHRLEMCKTSWPMHQATSICSYLIE